MSASAGDPYGQADDRDLLGNAIATLSPDHRVVVALRYYRDLQVDEIATRLGIPAGTVHSRLHYALKQLQRVIDVADGKGTLR
jgi:RNA polymerase sigma-70 factor (ECF subfamily)